jgi:hypothetical protein
MKDHCETLPTTRSLRNKRVIIHFFSLTLCSTNSLSSHAATCPTGNHHTSNPLPNTQNAANEKLCPAKAKNVCTGRPRHLCNQLRRRRVMWALYRTQIPAPVKSEILPTENLKVLVEVERASTLCLGFGLGCGIFVLLLSASHDTSLLVITNALLEEVGLAGE